MHRSDAHLDAPRGLVRLRFPAFTGDLRGVRFRDGEALDGCAPHIAASLCGIMGPALVVVGPWEATPDPAPGGAVLPSSGVASPMSAPSQSSVSPPAPPAPAIAAAPPAGGVSPSSDVRPRKGR